MKPHIHVGTVKFYLVRDGYGFITPEGSDPGDKTQDRFFHHSQLNVERLPRDKYKSIFQGTRVLFTPIENEKGLAAMNVTPI